MGLHPQLLAYDVLSSDGANVGFNVQNAIVGSVNVPTKQTAGPGEVVKYSWCAGDVSIRNVNGVNTRVATPIEFGATNLVSSDPIKHSNKAAFASLVIEPQGATWIEDANSRSPATVTADGTNFREFVFQFQNDLNLRFGDRTGDAAVPNVANEEDAEDSGQKASRPLRGVCPRRPTRPKI